MAELDNFNKLKDEPWQQVTHAYYEQWGCLWCYILKCISYVVKNELEEGQGTLEPFTQYYVLGFINESERHVTRLPKKQQ